MLAAPNRQSGFTLIEIMIGLAVLGLLSVLAVPAYQHWVRNTQIRNGTEGLLNGMQLARAEAVRLNAQVQLVVGPGPGTGWTVSNAVTGTTIQSRSMQQGSTDASISIQPAGADRVTFNGMGWLNSNGDGSASITQIDVTSGSYTGTETRPLRLVVSAGGMVRMCDPAVGAGDPRACP